MSSFAGGPTPHPFAVDLFYSRTNRHALSRSLSGSKGLGPSVSPIEIMISAAQTMKMVLTVEKVESRLELGDEMLTLEDPDAKR